MSNAITTYFHQLNEYGHGWSEYLDMIWCAVRYGASPNNYAKFGFAGLDGKRRATYVTNRVSRKMIKKCNDPRFCGIFEDKVKFAEAFREFFGRDWISTENMTFDRFCGFVRNKEKFIYKPVGNAQAIGVEVYEDLSDVRGVYDAVTGKNETAILEQWITQHPVLSEIYPYAINCLRIITVYTPEGGTHFLTGGLTIGNGGAKIANASASGIVAPVDMETGILSKPAADFEGHVYEYHPSTGRKITGTQIPYWQEVKELLEKAAAKIPQVRYVGWDLAITPDGPVIIEGNTTPGYKYYQIPVHLENKIGNRAVYEQFI